MSSKGVEIPDEFKAVPGISDRWVSRDGRVMNERGRVLRGHITSKGYVVVWCGDKKRKVFAHRLVTATFIPNPDSKPFINHIDGNRRNNKMENLEWCTQQENLSEHRRVVPPVVGLKSTNVTLLRKCVDKAVCLDCVAKLFSCTLQEAEILVHEFSTAKNVGTNYVDSKMGR